MISNKFELYKRRIKESRKSQAPQMTIEVLSSYRIPAGEKLHQFKYK